MKAGFTGTRNGMARSQIFAFTEVVGQLWPAELHHGACIGADEDAAVIASSLHPIRIIAHPGGSARTSSEPYRSQKAIEVSDEVREEKHYFVRNRDIVDETDLLIVCPMMRPMSSSGGTVYTFNYARKMGKRVIIIWPDGTVEDSEAKNGC